MEVYNIYRDRHRQIDKLETGYIYRKIGRQIDRHMNTYEVHVCSDNRRIIDNVSK